MIELNVTAEPTIKVYDKDLSELAPCTKKRAEKLINRQCAVWLETEENAIQLLVNKKDRKQRREELARESGRICYICGERIPDDVPITIDHVKPKSEGGTDDKWNTKCACKRCNDDKKNRGIKTYVKHIRRNRHLYPYITKERLAILDDFVKEFYSMNLN
jgi:5-methylcytosine-specific restriction endonuclease McrA